MDNLIQITVIDRSGEPFQIEAPTDMGLNLMEICKSSGLPVEGTCGGMALCASCHVYILSENELSAPSDDELAMLDQAFFVKNNSRLGCQLKMAAGLDGLVAELAPV